MTLICVVCGNEIKTGELMNYIPIADVPVHVPECPNREAASQTTYGLLAGRDLSK